MAKFLLDSDIIIWFLRGKKATIDLIEELKKSGAPACSPISIIEIQLGIKKGEEKTTSEFLNSLEVYSINREIANLAGEYIKDYKKRGTSLTMPDAIIGATCVLYNFVLVTYNVRHYPFKALKICSL